MLQRAGPRIMVEKDPDLSHKDRWHSQHDVAQEDVRTPSDIAVSKAGIKSFMSFPRNTANQAV